MELPGTCGVAGQRVIKAGCQEGYYDRLVHLVCTDPPHEGNEHYDETYSLGFGEEIGRADQ